MFFHIVLRNNKTKINKKEAVIGLLLENIEQKCIQQKLNSWIYDLNGAKILAMILKRKKIQSEKEREEYQFHPKNVCRKNFSELVALLRSYK